MEATDYSRRQFPPETMRNITAKLLRGQKLAAQLQILLQSASATEHDRRALAAKILSSFTEAISDLNSSEFAADELSCPDHSLCSDLDSGDSLRSTAVKDLGRGNKRRRVGNSRIVTSVTTADGHAWRKYGQKVILNATHPRSYFRCTHKFDRGCKATKHVQKMEGDSQMYKITYTSDHTCGHASPIAVVAVAEDNDPSASGCFNICFSDSRNDGLNNVWLSDDDNSGVKAGGGETTSGLTDEVDIWSELKDFGSLPPETTADSSSSMFWDQFLR